MKTILLSKNNLVKLLSIVITILVTQSCKKTTSETIPQTMVIDNSVSYSSKMTKSDKKKYYNKNGSVAYEIKYKPDGFKLRTESSQLLWKIKFYDSKIKISDNEENLNPFEIKIMETYQAKLVKNEVKIAKTKYDLKTKTQTVLYSDESKKGLSKTKPYSPSFLVNCITQIPENQKQIIINELIDKGY